MAPTFTGPGRRRESGGARSVASPAARAGFTLIEVSVALLLTMVAVLGLTRLLVAALQSQSDAVATTVAAALARDKMEELRGLFWGFDDAGEPAADGESDVALGLPTGGRGLSELPLDALERDVEGACDYLDAMGRRVSGGSRPTAAFVRRWRIRLDAADRRNLVELRVVVVPLAGRWAGAPPGARLPGYAALGTLRARKVPA